METIFFGGGCFWCTEAVFKNLKGVISVVPGYMGGITNNPSYSDICKGDTMHAEVIQLRYDSYTISLNQLLTVFFATHDPTTLNQQGYDIGTQYRSVIYCTNDDQMTFVKEFISSLEVNRVFDNPIVTEVQLAPIFYQAEIEHHDYFTQNPLASYCQFVILPKVEKLEHYFRFLLK